MAVAGWCVVAIHVGDEKSQDLDSGAEMRAIVDDWIRDLAFGLVQRR